MIATGGTAPRPTLGFIGAGRAGSALAVAARHAGYAVTAVSSRTPAHASALAAQVGAQSVPSGAAVVGAADITFLTVPDSAIAPVAEGLAGGVAMEGRSIVHCSAVQGREALAALRRTAAGLGAIHPLQALSGSASAPLLRGSGFAIDADRSLEAVLTRFAGDLGGVVLPLEGVDRRLYHAAAVLAGNAPLALLDVATRLLAEAGLDRDAAERALATLLAGAADNARRVGVRAALTGPVVRGDQATVQGHLEALQSHAEVADLYRALAVETAHAAA